MTKTKSNLDLKSVKPITDMIKEKIAAGEDKEYLFSLTEDNLCKFTKVRHVIGEDGEPLEQHWVEYVDLKNFNKIIKKFNENMKRIKEAQKQLRPIIDKFQNELGGFTLEDYTKYKDLLDKFEHYTKYKNQLETIELQKVDAQKWKEVYVAANKEIGKTITK